MEYRYFYTIDSDGVRKKLEDHKSLKGEEAIRIISGALDSLNRENQYLINQVQNFERDIYQLLNYLGLERTEVVSEDPCGQKTYKKTLKKKEKKRGRKKTV